MKRPRTWIKMKLWGALLGSLSLPVQGQAREAQPPRAGSVQSAAGSSTEPPTRPVPEDGDGASATSRAHDAWAFTLSPYLWASSIRAETDAGPISATSEACFSDLLKKLDMAAQLGFEGLYEDRWGFYLDGAYLSLGEEARARVGRFRFRGIDIDAQFTQAWLDFGGMYRVGQQGRSFDLMLGGRYTYLGTDVSVGPFEVDKSEDFIAPMAGGRVQYDLSEKWLVSVKGEVGGFGLGDSADLVWGATALLGYRLNERATLGIGYRYYDLDYSSGRLDADISFYGPIVGMAFHF